MSKILIVEDADDNAQVLKIVLETNGYETIRISDGDDFFNILSENNKIDLILLDINLPNFNGLTLCKNLRENEIYKQIPVIMLTSDNATESKVTAFKLGATDYLTKPFQSLELLARVKSQLKIQDMQKTLLEYEKYKTQIDILFNLSHEINNPLAIILGLTQIMQIEANNNNETERIETCKVIEENVKRISNCLFKMRTDLKKQKNTQFEKENFKFSEISADNKKSLNNHTMELSALVVDDEEQLTKLYTKFLKFYKFTVDQSLDAVDAIKKCREKNYTLIVMDVMLPGMNGLDAFREIKKNYTERNIKLPYIVLNSGFAVENIFQKGLEEGVFRTLKKPIDINAFYDFIMEIISVSKKD